ncbi:hypothetical protein V6R21_14875 [Limibacter armeniacum]|uniref:hypothetical protein n=1 Tax=Limibacter armeniacum TaxID=466084 RepID=UPI002FE6748A
MEKNKLFYVVLTILVLITFGCSDQDDSGGVYQPNYLPSLDAATLPASNRAMIMFEDDESPSKMYDKNDRWFRVNQPLQVVQNGKDSVQISLYSPVGLSDVKIYAKLPNYDKRFVIFNFSHIPAFHRSFHKIPLTEGDFDYELETGNAVTIDKIEGFSSGAIEFSVESEDPLFLKFQKIKSTHLVQFHDAYHINEYGKFLPMNPVLAKEAITMIINYSYALSHPIYYDTFTNFDAYKKDQAELAGTSINGATDWHGNAADSVGYYDYFTKDEIENIYGYYLDDRTLYMAMVGGSAAWGGGPLASQWESSYIRGHWLGDMSIWSHEYSHHIGYSHSSNLANSGEGGGQQEMLTQFYKYLIYLEDLPFTDPEILKGWTKTEYLSGTYQKPVFEINDNNPFLLKYKGEGKWN